MSGKHDLSHSFIRYDTPLSVGYKSGVANQSIGLPTAIGVQGNYSPLKFDVICGVFISGCRKRAVNANILLKLDFRVKVKIMASFHNGVSVTVSRAALTGKHDTLVSRAPGWQGAPDGQQAKKISCYKMFILHNKRFDMTS